jgi:phosphohistidine phosphatase
MKLYLIRHATASDIANTDADRELTDEGRQEARIAGAALAKLGAKPSHILTSPLVRARQTAELVAKELNHASAVEELDELQNSHSTSSLLRALHAYSTARELVLVGHMPGLAEHLAALIGARNAGGLWLGKGTIACVALDELKSGAGQLRWLMRQKQLREIAR